MAGAALRLAERPGLGGLGRWVQMLGFRGHFVTKSRGYSTTLGELRAARAAYRAHQDQAPDDAQNDNDSTVVLSVWEYVGSGYLTRATYSSPQALKPPYVTAANTSFTAGRHDIVYRAGHSAARTSFPSGRALTLGRSWCSSAGSVDGRRGCRVAA